MSQIIDGLKVAMLGTTDGDFIDPNSDIPAGEMFRLAAEYIESLTVIDWAADSVPNDGTYEYTGTSDCDGSNFRHFRRFPAEAIYKKPTTWEAADASELVGARYSDGSPGIRISADTRQEES